MPLHLTRLPTDLLAVGLLLGLWLGVPATLQAQTGGCLVDEARALAVCPADAEVALGTWVEQRLGVDYDLMGADGQGGSGGLDQPAQPGVVYEVMTPQGVTLSLWASDLPLIDFRTSAPIQDDPKVPASMTLALPGEDVRTVDIGVEWRGFAAQIYDKKNYELEVKGDDVQLPGLRNDDDWVLNGMPDEPQRIRSYLAQNLWLDMARRPASFSDEAVVGAGATFVELAIDGDYRGLYLISEQIDRKQLDLTRPTDAGEITGQLFKAGFWSEATQWRAAPPYDNAEPSYEQWEQKHPDVDDYPIDYSGLHSALELSAEGSDEALVDELTANFDLDNLVDYFLWLNVTLARDNLGTNTYVARNCEGAPWVILPWDMDATFGSIWDGTYEPDNAWVLNNRVTERLIESPWPGFREAAAARYFQLRETLLSEDALRARARAAHAIVKEFGADERELLRWADVPFSTDEQWIVQAFAGRIGLLDEVLGRWRVDEVTPPPANGVADCGQASPDDGPSSVGDRDLPALTVAPNPVRDRLTVTLSDGEAPIPAQLHVSDLSGRLVSTVPVASDVVTLDASAWPAGVYVLRAAGHAPVRVVRSGR